MKAARLLVLTLVCVFILGMASIAMAAQPSYQSPQDNGELAEGYLYDRTYLPTKSENVYLPNSDPSEYRIHSNYSNNTDACAACHATHTAVGESLLQWGTVYAACTACHDGTVTTTYDVKGGKIGNTGATTKGGLFGTTAMGSLSNHNVTGAVQVYAAPGGTLPTDSEFADNSKKDSKTVAWDMQFGCESCHTPHGQGGNARILNPDPNGVSTIKYYDEVKVKNGGKGVQLETVTVGSDTYFISKLDGTNPDLWIKGYPYSKNTKIVDNNGIEVTGWTLDNSDGVRTLVKGLNPSNTYYATYVPVVKVDMEVSGYLTAGETVTYKAGINSFCGACHTDYNTEGNKEDGSSGGAGQHLTGTYTEAYRHQVGNDITNLDLSSLGMAKENNKLSCLTCHFAHGTSETLWNATLPAGYKGPEIAGSSALKRIPNMGTCEACHSKGDGAEGYGETVTPTLPEETLSNAGATYVGSSKCATCHKSYYDGWKTTAKSKKIQKAYNDDGSLAGLTQEAKTAVENWLAADATSKLTMNGSGVTPKTKTLADVEYVVGYHFAQRFLVSDPEVDGYRFLSQQYQFSLIDGQTPRVTGWGNKDAYQDNCIDCHTTGYRLQDYNNGDKRQNLMEYITELGVGCEKCHGPASNHLVAPSSKNILNPATMTMQQQTELCGSCHARPKGNGNSIAGSVRADGNLRNDSYGYKPGMDLLTDDAANATGKILYMTLDNMGNTSDFYQPGTDLAGASKGSRQQYQDFIQSKHYTSGSMSCSTCHSSHSLTEEKEQLKMPYSQLCATCHGSGFDMNEVMPSTYSSGGNVGNDGRGHFFTPDGKGPRYVAAP